MMSETTAHSGSTGLVLALLFFWIILVLALVYFYKKLNTETNGQYTVQKMVLGPNGLRDRLRQGVGVLENRLGVNIWPRPREDEENIEGNDEEDEEEAEGHDKQKDSFAEEDEQNEEDKDDSSSDYSSVDLRERVDRQKKEKKTEEEEGKKKEEEEEEGAAGGEEEQKEEVKNEERVGLLVDLTPFSGSAIWSEENKDGSEGNDLTAL